MKLQSILFCLMVVKALYFCHTEIFQNHIKQSTAFTWATGGSHEQSLFIFIANSSVNFQLRSSWCLHLSANSDLCVAIPPQPQVLLNMKLYDDAMSSFSRKSYCCAQMTELVPISRNKWGRRLICLQNVVF